MSPVEKKISMCVRCCQVQNYGSVRNVEERGAWCTEHGARSMVRGAWSVERGVQNSDEQKLKFMQGRLTKGRAVWGSVCVYSCTFRLK